MKKLMTMIGALAAAFGLYAADVSLDASYISFESDYPGCGDGQTLDVTQPTDDGDYFWISELEEAPAIAAFEDGEAAKLPYGPTGRRKEFTDTGIANADYLKLDTGKESLFRTLVDCGEQHTAVPVDVSAGPVFIDTLVKFTAFEDEQTFTAEDGTKIAVWMKATEGDEGGETNLYISAGCDASGEAFFQAKNIKLDGAYEADTWYRLTVKSVGSIFDPAILGEVPAGDRLGFVVYINGALVSTEEALFDLSVGYLNATAQALATEGQLFPSITAGLTLSGVGFKGMGSIDDLYTGAGEPFPSDVVIVIPPTSDEWTAVPEVEKAAPGAVINFTLTTKGDKLFKGNKSKTMVVTGTVGVDGTVTLDPEADIETGDAAAKIGTTLYLTLNEAFKAAIDTDEIEMLDDVTLSERIFIGSADGDKDITLDLAGKAITWDASVDNASGVFIVRSGSKLTVEDSSGTNAGKIDANGKAYAAIAITHGTYQDNDKTASLIVNGGTLVGFYQGIVGNGTRPNTYVEINGGVITATNTTAEDGNLAIFNPQQNSEVVINGGTLTGLWAAIEMRGGTLTVNDGTLTATAEEYAVKPNGSGSTTAGAAVAVAQHTTEGDIEVEIKGGTLTGVKAVSVANPQGNTTDNVEVTLGDAEYDGELAFSADGNATVTNDGADLDAPAGYVWQNGVLTKMALPEVAYKEVPDDDYAKRFEFVFADGKKGVGYDDWKASFKVVSNVDIDEDEITFYGTVSPTGCKLDFNGCKANEEFYVPLYVKSGSTEFTVKEVYETIKTLKWGIWNHGLKNDATFKIELVITSPDGEETKTLCDISQFDIAAKEYTITYMNGDKAFTDLTPATYKYSATDAVSLPETVALTGGEFKGWYDNAAFTGEAVTEIPAGSTGDKTFYAKVEELTGEPAKVLANDVEGEIPDDKKDQALENAKVLVNAKTDEVGVKAWIESVYGTGSKIPAAKLANATADDVAIALKYDVPIMTEGTAVVAGTEADGFVFTLKDGDETVLLQEAAKIDEMISWTDELVTKPFEVNKTEVGTELSEGKIKAVFKKPNNEAKGFMKLILTPPAK